MFKNAEMIKNAENKLDNEQMDEVAGGSGNEGYMFDPIIASSDSDFLKASKFLKRRRRFTE